MRLHCVNVISKKDEELKQARMQIGNMSPSMVFFFFPLSMVDGFSRRKKSYGGKNKTRTGRNGSQERERIAEEKESASW